MTAAFRTCIAVLLLVVPAAVAAQPEWLSAELMEAMVQQLAQSLRAVDPEGEIVADDGVAIARAGIAGTVARIESLGKAEVLEMAPDFPELELPSAAEPHIDAIAHWGICSFPSQAAYADSSPEGGGAQRRISAAAMMTTVALVNTFLRHEYLQAGTTEEEVQAFYADPELAATIRELQTSGQLLLHTMEQCLEPINRLMR